jgi:hypothetical protein
MLVRLHVRHLRHSTIGCAPVVAVMMRVDEEVDLATAGTLVQSAQARRCLSGELAVNHDDGARVHQITDGAATHGEVADVPADGREDRLRRLTLPGAREGRPAEYADGRGGGGSGEEIAAGDGHRIGPCCMRSGATARPGPTLRRSAGLSKHEPGSTA